MSSLRFSRPTALVTMIAGYLVWSSCFVVLYSLLSIGCELQWQRFGLLGISSITLMLIFAWLLHLLALGWLIRAAWQAERAGLPPPSRFVRRVTLILHLTAFAATIWIGLPILALPPCA